MLPLSLALMKLRKVVACLFLQHGNRFRVLVCQRVLPYPRPQYHLTAGNPLLHLHISMLYPKALGGMELFLEF